MKRDWSRWAAVCVVLAGAACGSDKAPGDQSLTPTATATPSGPSEWPMYGHDPSHTNTNANETVLTRDTLARLAPVWQADIGASDEAVSNSTPSVFGGRVYVGSSIPVGPNFFSFDALTGTRVWATDLHYRREPFCDANENVGIPSTPAIADGVVVVGGGDAAYYGVSVESGAMLWGHALDVGNSGYAWASPAVVNGVAYVGASSHCDNPPVRGDVRALRLADGKLLAQQFFAPEGGRGGGLWNSPAVTPDGGTVIAATGEDNDGGPYEQALVALDGTTLAVKGAQKEGAGGGDADFAISPVVFHDSAGRVMAGSSVKAGTFYAFRVGDVASGPVWSRPIGVAIGMMPAYDPAFGKAGALFVVGTQNGGYFSGANAMLYALDPDTGKDVWPPVLISYAENNLAIASGMIFLNTATQVLVLDETNGSVLRALVPSSAGASVSGIAVAEGGVYWVSGTKLNAWRVPN